MTSIMQVLGTFGNIAGVVADVAGLIGGVANGVRGICNNQQYSEGFPSGNYGYMPPEMQTGYGNYPMGVPMYQQPAPPPPAVYVMQPVVMQPQGYYQQPPQEYCTVQGNMNVFPLNKY